MHLLPCGLVINYYWYLLSFLRMSYFNCWKMLCFQWSLFWVGVGWKGHKMGTSSGWLLLKFDSAWRAYRWRQDEVQSKWNFALTFVYNIFSIWPAKFEVVVGLSLIKTLLCRQKWTPPQSSSFIKLDWTFSKQTSNLNSSISWQVRELVQLHSTTWLSHQSNSYSHKYKDHHHL